MLISTDQGGGEIVSAHDDTRFYDDVGCLAADWLEHRDQASAYVRLEDGTWRLAQDASYGQPATAQTAMGSGFTAYSTMAEARAADREGRVLGWDDVVERAGARR